ncbi:MAG: UbiX family flavin prenyltransferase [Mogibacterium sp.]|nr:UbiX family flavin prenyltransferase [Mogibacterium sp.]
MRIIVGISGASGVILGYSLLRTLHEIPEVEVHLVVTESGIRTFRDETNLTMEDVYQLADYVYDNSNIGATISSGSFRTDGMIVIPCSMKTASAAAHAYNENLLVRAMDVCIKENRRVVIVPREMPLNKIHLHNLELMADAGYTIIPPMLTFYNRADTVEKQINHIVGKVLSQFGIYPESFVPWQGSEM